MWAMWHYLDDIRTQWNNRWQVWRLSVMEKYVKADKIGEGSFGVAFLARIKGSNKQVVLKEINLTKVRVTFWDLSCAVVTGTFW